MMTQDCLNLIRDLALALTPISDMALLMGIPESTLRLELGDRSTDASRIYRTARAETALRLRRRDMELAEAGSPSAAEAVSVHYRRMLQDE